MVLCDKIKKFFFLKKFRKVYRQLFLSQKFQENFQPLSFKDYKSYLKEYYSTTLDMDDIRKNYNNSFNLLGVKYES